MQKTLDVELSYDGERFHGIVIVRDTTVGKINCNQLLSRSLTCSLIHIYVDDFMSQVLLKHFFLA